MIKSTLTNKSQVWGFDLMAAVIIFTVGILFIYIYAINTSNSSGELNKLQREGQIVSSLILSEGSPRNWNMNNVETPGILTDKKVNRTKLEMLNDLSENDYKELKDKLELNKYEFYLNFSISEMGNIGKKPANSKNIIKIDRATIYNNKITKLNLYIWN